jgi:hypothetical protein
MSIADWATTISGFLAVVLAAAGAFRWLIKNYLSEMKPNGGGSMRDDITEIKVLLAKLEGKFEQHIEEHSR